MSSDDKKDREPASDYEVGNKKPPKDGQFPPGVSGQSEGTAQGKRQPSDPGHSAAAPDGDGHP